MLHEAAASERLISVVIPALNEAACLPALHCALSRVCDDLPYRFEFLFVDDGSTDDTPVQLAALAATDPRVRYLILTRNFGHQAAITAGLDHAEGEAVIMLDADLQHPPELIPDLLIRWEAGFEVVQAIRRRTLDGGWLKRACSRLFYALLNASAGSTQVRAGAADFRLVSRRVVEVLRQLPPGRRFYRGLFPALGFRISSILFDAPPRLAGHSQYNFARNLQLASDGLTANGGYPLRRLLLPGLACTIIGLLGLVTATGLFMGGRSLPGEAWIALAACLLGGVQLVSLAVIGEYLTRILDHLQGRPAYLIQDRNRRPQTPATKEQDRTPFHIHHRSVA